MTRSGTDARASALMPAEGPREQNFNALDPITREVVIARLDAIVREMGNITLRTSRSLTVNSGRDFSCGIFSRDAELLAIGTSIPTHIFPMTAQMGAAVRLFGDELAQGDIFLANDPYDGGTHLNDVLLFVPVFCDERLVGYVANRAHWYDIGGTVPGSIWGDAREIYQEGLRIPPIRAGRAHELDENILRLILLNVRTPDEVRGDIQAQLASCKRGGELIGQMIQRYGWDVVSAIWAWSLDAGEARTRRRLETLPRGTTTHDGYLDNDGVDADARRIQVTLGVGDGEVTVDYRGSAGQSAGPMNITAELAKGYAFMGVKAAVDPKGRINAGCFRPVHVVLPERSCLSAEPPGAGGGMAEVGLCAILTMSAFARWCPEDISAEDCAAANHMNLTCFTDDGGVERRLIYYDALSAGAGARLASDGLDYIRSIRSGNYQVPGVELLEHLYPILLLEHRLRDGSGGAGQRRGGLGAVREYRVLSDGSLSVLGDHAIVPPAGTFGGHRGAPTRWSLMRDGVAMLVAPRMHSKGTVDLKAGDVVRIETPGGGGWGDPLERGEEAVERDVRDRRVTRADAHELYGVVFQNRGAFIDAGATATRRDELRASRIRCALKPGRPSEFFKGVRVAEVAPATFEQVVGHGLGPRRLAELYSETLPNPIVVTLVKGDGELDGAVWLDCQGCAASGLEAGAELKIRPLPIEIAWVEDAA